ncbi:MAG TPA: sensor histidine kinase [Granulicella sp.]
MEATITKRLTGGHSSSERLTGAAVSLSILAIAGALAAITGSECHANLTLHHIAVSFTPSFLYGAVTWFWWAAVALFLGWCALYQPITLRFSLRTVLLHLAAACLLAASHLYLLQHTIWWVAAHWPPWGQEYHAFYLETPQRFGADLVIYALLYGFSGLMYAQSQAQKAIIQKLELERQLSQAQLHVLQMQLEPHFLFNTLNAVNSLVDLGRNKEASQTLAHLNTILRSALQRSAPEKVPFAEELRIIESYLTIQRVRFADRLQVTLDVAPEALEGMVPCFLLQPIMENAIHHGIAPMEAGGIIATSIKRRGDKLWMQIRDNGAGVSTTLSQGHGIGIRNTRERLAYFYPNAHDFKAGGLATGGYEVTIEIPFERVAL